MNSRLNFKSIFITGGTGSVGRLLVMHFSKQNYEVVFQYANNDRSAEELSKQTGATPWKSNFLSEVNIPDRNFDVIVNSAAILITTTPTHEVTIGEWQNTIAVNLTMPFLIIQKYLSGMIQKRWGRIINIGSICSMRSVDNNSSYNVSKHGLSGLTKSVAKEYAQFGITCNEICPSAIESEIMNQIASRKEKEGKMSALKFLDLVRLDNPSGRMVLPDDIPDLALFLASDQAAFINGQSIVVDGGQIC